MEKKTYLTAFNTQLENFSKELCNLYPKDITLKTTFNSIMILKKTNPRKLLELYKFYVSKYENQINKEDEKFFIKNDYNEVINDLDYDSSYTTNIITKLKDYWSTMNNETQKNIWLYLKVLIKLSKKT